MRMSAVLNGRGAGQGEGMHWKQVCQTALAFSASRGASLVQSQPHPNGALTLLPIRSTAEIVVQRNNQDSESWYVHLVPARQRRPALKTVYFPTVSTPEELSRTLGEAWVMERCMRPE